MKSKDDIDAEVALAADHLWQAWVGNVPCDPVREILGNDVAAAYRVQELNTSRQLARGDRVHGYKIGLTSKAVQEQLGVDQPDYGPLFESRRIANAGSVDLSRTVAPRAEAEIALVLGRDITDPDVDPASILAATEYASPSIEIVDSRVRDWNISIADTIADFASGCMFVLGSERIDPSKMDLVSVEMTLTVDGTVVSTGSGEATMGDPLVAAAWLARTVIGLGGSLREGDVILTGALGPVHSIIAGQHVVAELTGLGSASFTTQEGQR